MQDRNPGDRGEGISRGSATKTGAAGVLCATLSLGLIAACMNQTFKGAWSYETKQNILDSYTMLSARVFLPWDAPGTLTNLPQAPDPIAMRRLHLRLQELLDEIALRHAASHARLSTTMRQDLLPEIRVRLNLTTTGQPLAHVEENGDLTIDLLVIQAMFRATVMTGVPQKGWWTYGEYDLSGIEPLSPAAEVARIAEFQDFRGMVERETGYCAIGDLLTGIFAVKWGDNAERVALIEERILGGLLFLLAHEVGHLVLGHFRHTRSVADEAAFQAAELQADRYAAALIGDAKGAEWIFGRMYRVTRTIGGFDLFFRTAYSLAGFERVPGNGGFRHPEPRARREAAIAAYDAAAAQASKEDKK